MSSDKNFTPEQTERIQKRKDFVSYLLNTIPGENPGREGLGDTPKRVSKMYEEIFAGYEQKPEEVLGTCFATDNSEMVVVRDIDYYSTCEHHMVPFFGKVHIGYVPNGKVLGLSKFARLVEIFARRLQIQEQMTEQIAAAIEEHLKPHGVIVVVEGQHLCMMMRGVQKLNSTTTTSAVRGNFKTQPETRQEFFNIIGR